MNKQKKDSITTGIIDPTDNKIANAICEMTSKRIHELCRKHGSPIKKYKWETALGLARTINAPGRGLTATVTLSFLRL